MEIQDAMSFGESDMAEAYDGGSAFPSAELIHETDEGVVISKTMTSGMSLRQWYAGKAMQGMLASGHIEAIEKLIALYEGKPAKGVAVAAYGFADAMLRQGSEFNG